MFLSMNYVPAVPSMKHIEDLSVLTLLLLWSNGSSTEIIVFLLLPFINYNKD